MKEKLARTDGHLMAVIRPVDPELALKEVFNLMEHQEGKSPEQIQEEFDAIISKQDYIFMGYLTIHGKIADETGKIIEHQMQRGDSMIDASELVNFKKVTLQ